MNIFNIERAFKDKKERGWEKLYWCIDVHDVILEGVYKKNNDGARYLPNALKVLRYLSKRSDTVLILWTSSHGEPTRTVLENLRKEEVYFKFVNENLDCPSNELCNFDRKFYFNILLDDKSCFEKNDWYLIEQELKRIGQWTD
jgi:hypothetical protein